MKFKIIFGLCAILTIFIFIDVRYTFFYLPESGEPFHGLLRVLSIMVLVTPFFYLVSLSLDYLSKLQAGRPIRMVIGKNRLTAVWMETKKTVVIDSSEVAYSDSTTLVADSEKLAEAINKAMKLCLNGHTKISPHLVIQFDTLEKINPVLLDAVKRAVSISGALKATIVEDKMILDDERTVSVAKSDPHFSIFS